MEDRQGAVALRVPAAQPARLSVREPIEADLLHRGTHPCVPGRDHFTLLVAESPEVVEAERDVVPMHHHGAAEARRIDRPPHDEASAEPTRLTLYDIPPSIMRVSPPGARAYCVASPSKKYSSSI